MNKTGNKRYVKEGDILQHREDKTLHIVRAPSAELDALVLTTVLSIETHTVKLRDVIEDFILVSKGFINTLALIGTGSDAVDRVVKEVLQTTESYKAPNTIFVVTEEEYPDSDSFFDTNPKIPRTLADV